jgi:predicted transcriptional regulator
LTIAEEILKGISILVYNEQKNEFSRKDVRDLLKIDKIKWSLSYNPIFQAMRISQGRAPLIKEEYVGLLIRKDRGIYTLTPKGFKLINKYKPNNGAIR